MTAKVDKEIRNGANRAMNCDMANVNKTIDAALEQKIATAANIAVTANFLIAKNRLHKSYLRGIVYYIIVDLHRKLGESALK